MLPYPKEALDRKEKIKLLKEAWVIVYANHFRWKEDIKNILPKEESFKDASILMENWAEWDFKTAWRLMSFKSHWKLAFWKIKDASWEVQVCFVRDKFKLDTWRDIVEELEIAWEELKTDKIINKYLHIWDFIWVKWDLFLTKHEEKTLFVSEIKFLSKAIRPMPEKWHWVQDTETIYRQRYLDMISNKDSFDRFVKRSEFVKAVRDFYHKNSFMEIETPVLWNAASGAAAQPFITHHNDFDSDFFLRIAPETALKKATVWGLERVFEIWKNFRNEWSDPSHMQEFTAIEHYCVFWNFEDNMQFTQDMFDYIFEHTSFDKKVMIKDKNWVEKEVDFTTPWEKIDYIEWVKKESWIDITAYWTEDEEKLRADIKAKWIEFAGMDTMWTTTLIDYLYKKVLRPKIVGPAFVYNYPKTMQPLARQSDENENIVEQFQVVVNWWEILKAYSELVDPKTQQENFDNQAWALENWDEEATSWDDDFVLAMEYGMPCQSGWGMWVDRIVSLLTGQENLRDVVLFPLMKEDDNIDKTEKKED